ncbi:MAG: homoserine dehydrogenase [Chloroflexota bacterium]
MANAIGVGLLGLGVVGAGVARALIEKRDTIANRVGHPVELRRAVVRDLERSREIDAIVPITTDPATVLDDPDIQVVVEVMGGEHPALEYILRAIDAGKHVVTANKEVMAKHGPEILLRAADRGVDVAYEASVGGGIPVIGPFKLDLLANDISQITAIINGTTNYIITRMARDGMEFGAALREAQDQGFAESDPRNDVEGIDAAYKLAILASLAFHARVHPDDVYNEGITQLSPSDFRYANELGYVIKLLAIGKLNGSGIELRVHPAMVPADTMLANVDGVFNAVQVDGDLVGRILFYGRGAGSGPTSSAVVADIIDIAQRAGAGAVGVPPRPYDTSRHPLPFADVRTRYYLRLISADQPGVIAAIATILSNHNISLSSVIQKEDVEPQNGGSSIRHAEIVFMTHEATESAMQQAITEIRGLSVIDTIGSVIRVEA